MVDLAGGVKVRLKVGTPSVKHARVGSYVPGVTPGVLAAALVGAVFVNPQTGKIPDDQLASVVARTNVAQSWTADQTVDATLNTKRLRVTQDSLASIVTIVKGATGQTADLQQWQNSTGGTVARIAATGLFGIEERLSVGSNAMFTSAAQVNIKPQYGSYVGSIIRAATGQTADLEQWQDSAGTVKTRIDSTGALDLAGMGSNVDIIKFPNGAMIGRHFAGGDFNGNALSGNWSIGGEVDMPGSVRPRLASSVGLTVKGRVSQTGNLQNWVDSNGTVLARINSSGGLVTGNGASGNGDSTISNLLTVQNGTGGNATLDVTTSTAGGTARLVVGASDAHASSRKWSIIVGGGNVSGSGGASLSEGTLLFQETTTARALFRRGGSFQVNPPNLDPGGSTFVGALSAATVGSIIRGAASQTADLQQWQQSDGTATAKIDAAGRLVLQAINAFAVPLTIKDQTGTDKFMIGASGIATVVGGLNMYNTYVSSAGLKTNLYGSVALNTGGATTDVAPNLNGAILSAVSTGAGNPVAVFRGVASQTADLQQWQDTNATVVSRVSATGDVILSGSMVAGGTKMNNVRGALYAGGASVIPLVLQGAAGQTSDLQQWQNSSGAILAQILSDGRFITQTHATVKENLQVGYNALDGSARFRVSVENGGSVPVVVRGAATGQSAALAKFQDGTGHDRFTISSGGSLTLLRTAPVTAAGQFSSSASLNFQSSTWDASLNAGAGGESISNAILGNSRQGGAGAQSRWWVGADSNPDNSVLAVALDGSKVVTVGVGFASANEPAQLGVQGQTAYPNRTGAKITMPNIAGAATAVLHVDSPASGQGANLIQADWAGSPRFWVSRSGELHTTTSITTPALNLPNLGVINANGTNGGLGTGGAAYNNVAFTVTTKQFNFNGLDVRGIVGQTADLQRWMSDTGAVLAKVAADGSFTSVKDIYLTRSDVSAAIVASEGLRFVSSATVGKNFNFDTQIFANNKWPGSISILARGASGQTADIQAWQDNTGANLARIQSNGALRVPMIMPIGGVGPDLAMYSSTIQVEARAATQSPLTVKGAASQTADLTQWQNSAGTVLASVAAGVGDGLLRVGSGTFPAQNGRTLAQFSNNNSAGTYLSLSSETGQSGLWMQKPSVGEGSAWQFRYNAGDAANPVEWIWSGSKLLSLNAGGALVATPGSGAIGFAIKQAAGNTADLQQWVDSGNTVMTSVNKDGMIRMGRASGMDHNQGLSFVSSSGTDWRVWTDSTGAFKIGGSAGGATNFWEARWGDTGFGANFFRSASRTAAQPIVVVRGSASQTADLQKWQNDAGTDVARMAQNGELVVSILTVNTESRYGNTGYTDPESGVARDIKAGNNGIATWGLATGTKAASGIPLRVKGAASQTADLQQNQDSVGVVLSSVKANGEFENNVAGLGIVAKSPDGTRYRLAPPNGGGPATWVAA